MADDTAGRGADDTGFRDAFWDALDHVRNGLLSLGDGHARETMPMTAQFDRAGSTLHFFTPANGHFATALGQGAVSHFYHSGPRHHSFSVVSGDLAPDADGGVRERLWSDEVEAWFPGKRDDPSIALLRLAMTEVRVWLPTSAEEAEQGRTADRHGRFRFD